MIREISRAVIELAAVVAFIGAVTLYLIAIAPGLHP